MPRYIDADALIDDIRKHSESYFADDFAHEWVDKQPSADVQPVVRCKDCKHWEPTVADRGYCKDLFGFGRWWKADDSCSYGVQKDGEQND